MRPCRLAVFYWAALILGLPTVALAQRELHWDSVDVTAHLDASGALRVTETQAMIFTGDWNGGERRFDIRPRQKLTFLGIDRSIGGTWYPLRVNPRLSTVDDYAWIKPTILRWRSRRPQDPAFLNTHLLYRLRYELSGILLQRGDEYVLDHDFLFPERDGIIGRFTLALTLDAAWRPKGPLPDSYAARGLAPGQGYVLTIPLEYVGTGTPDVLDTSRPADVRIAVGTLLGLAGLAVMLFFVQEQRNGRFAPLLAPLDEGWLREYLFKHPAEVVGAAWDGEIGAAEVVALIARMVSEGKLESEIGSDGSMILRLNVDRHSLEGHERTLVAHLFFDGRTETSRELVREYYKEQGFSPAREISTELQAAVEDVLPPGPPSRPVRFATRALLAIGGALLFMDWLAGDTHVLAAVGIVLGALLLAAVGWAAGATFRANIHWGRKAALFSLVPGLAAMAGVAAFLWFYAGPGVVAASPLLVFALAALALAVLTATTGAMKSRQSRAAIAFRKNLASARAFFISELDKPSPALRDEWYPWILAFGLQRQVDDWSAKSAKSTQHEEQEDQEEQEDRRSRSWPEHQPTAPSTTPSSWTGFGGGRSGGAGASGSWAAAASGIAADVAVLRPASSGGDDRDTGGDDRDSSHGGYSSSSSGGSSGGGGGGGW